MDVHPALATVLCERLGLSYPICQAGMGFLARGDLAAAVSRAGGLGVMGAEGFTPEELRQEIRRVRDLTDRPFGVDILFGEVKGPQDEAVTRYTDTTQRMVDVVIDEAVPVLVSGLGSPRGAIADAHAQGMQVMSIVGNVRHALRLEADGVDWLIAQGHEAGGHTGRIGTLALVPQIVDAVKLPVLAAGGIADGRGLVAALALGACGAWMGTRFVAAREAYCHDNYKNRIIDISEEGTVVSRAHSGKPCRLIRNAYTEYWDSHPEERLPFPQQHIQHGREASRRARMQGEIDIGGMPAGQISGMIRSVEGAADIVQRLVRESAAVLDRLVAG